MAKVTKLKHVRQVRQLAEALKEAGWRLTDSIHTASGAELNLGGPNIYICDVDSGQLILVGLAQDAFEQLDRTPQAKELTFEDVCNAFGFLLEDVIKRGKVTPKLREQLTVAAALYIRGTQSFAMVKAMLDRAQFVVLRYGRMGLLRPSPVLTKAHLSPAQVEMFAAQLDAVDRQRHPERFARGKVLPFRVTKKPLQ